MLPRAALDGVPIVGMAACALATSATDTDGARAVDMVSGIARTQTQRLDDKARRQWRVFLRP